MIDGFRDRLLLLAAVAWGWLALGTELLGSLGSIQRAPVLAWWCVGLAGAFVFGPPRRPLGLPWRSIEGGSWALIAALTVLLGWSFLQAWIAPPNNIDSMWYHLPRQVYWQQAGRLDHFPTHDLRQLTMPPLSEYAGLNLLVATGGDRWHNLIQWGSLVLTALAASLITRDLRGGVFAQLLAATLVVSTPPVFAEASNTKNDLVVAFWLVVTALWTLRLARSPTPWPSAARMPVLLGLCFGCLALTKGTGPVLASPIAVLAAFGLRRSRPWPVVGGVLLAVVINAPHLTRNWRAFGSPYGDETAAHNERVTNELLSPAAVVSNLSRNLSRQVALPLAHWNDMLDRRVADLHAGLGLSTNDPRTTYRRPLWGSLFYEPDNEDVTTAPVQTLLLLGLPLLLMGVHRRIDGRGVLLSWVLAAGSFLAFCVVFKWQLWHGRLLVPIFALGAPPVAIVCAAARRPLGLLAAAAAIAAVAPAVDLVQRPLLGPLSILRASRTELYFRGSPGVSESGPTLFELLTALEPKVVGLTEDSYVFMGPWIEASRDRPRFASFNPRFNPNHLAEPPPDVLLSAAVRVQHIASGQWYVRVATVGPFSLSVPGTAVGETLKRLERFGLSPRQPEDPQ